MMPRMIRGVLLVLLAGCTDTQRARYGALGEAHHVVCYSGGVEVYNGYSTGRVHSPDNSDGWRFMERGSGTLVEVSGDCIIRVEADGGLVR